jgi:hypothetical protein
MAGRPPSRAHAAPDAVTVEVADDPPEESLEPEELVTRALEERGPLTPARRAALDQTWRDVCHYEDEGSRKLKREIEQRFRRATHLELHPGCARVTIDVPMLPNRQFVRVNERTFVGTHEVWECEARTILALVHHARLVEAARMDDKGGGGFLDLDSPLAERARAIQRA